MNFQENINNYATTIGNKCTEEKITPDKALKLLEKLEEWENHKKEELHSA